MLFEVLLERAWRHVIRIEGLGAEGDELCAWLQVEPVGMEWWDGDGEPRCDLRQVSSTYHLASGIHRDHGDGAASLKEAEHLELLLVVVVAEWFAAILDEEALKGAILEGGFPDVSSWVGWWGQCHLTPFQTYIYRLSVRYHVGVHIDPSIVKVYVLTALDNITIIYLLCQGNI